MDWLGIGCLPSSLIIGDVILIRRIVYLFLYPPFLRRLAPSSCELGNYLGSCPTSNVIVALPKNSRHKSTYLRPWNRYQLIGRRTAKSLDLVIHAAMQHGIVMHVLAARESSDRAKALIFSRTYLAWRGCFTLAFTSAFILLWPLLLQRASGGSILPMRDSCWLHMTRLS